MCLFISALLAEFTAHCKITNVKTGKLAFHETKKLGYTHSQTQMQSQSDVAKKYLVKGAGSVSKD